MRLSVRAAAPALLLLALLAGCAGPRPADPARGAGSAASGDADATRGQALEQGRASWYGKPFHGRRTASGERFDMYALTAAHPSLPFGSRIKVRNQQNGKEVEVRINDRGPHARGRIIDLSYAAAVALDMTGTGEAPVLLMAP